MNINIKATGIELTGAISDYVHKRMSKVSDFLGSDGFLIAVEVGKTTKHHKQGDVFRAEVKVSGAGQNFYAVKEGPDLYASIDEVKDEVIHEISKTKGRKRELLRQGQRKIKEMMKGFPWIGRKG